MKTDIVVVSAVRTPFGRFGGSLRDIDCYDLSAIVMKEALRRAGLEGRLVDEVYWGVGDTSACKDVYTPVVARQALLKAGLPPETTSCSLDKACVSAMSAVQLGARGIRVGDIQVALCGGVTTFSREPLILRNLRWQGSRLGNQQLEDPLHALGYKDYNPVAVDTGEVALELGVSREEQDRWALRSHERYGRAIADGKFKEEMMPLNLSSDGAEKVLDIDEQYRPDATYEKLSRLKPIYGSPTVTAGNAPGLNDGAAAVVITSRGRAEALGFPILATIISMANAAQNPRYLATVPAYAIEKALQQAGLTLDDVDLFEVNEAFAAQPLVATKVLAQRHYDGDPKKLEMLREKTNVNGGAVAVGHANTASGARIMMTLIYELRRRGGGTGVAAICGGLAQGDAAVVRVEQGCCA